MIVYLHLSIKGLSLPQNADYSIDRYGLHANSKQISLTMNPKILAISD